MTGVSRVSPTWRRSVRAVQLTWFVLVVVKMMFVSRDFPLFNVNLFVCQHGVAPIALVFSSAAIHFRQ